MVLWSGNEENLHIEGQARTFKLKLDQDDQKKNFQTVRPSVFGPTPFGKKSYMFKTKTVFCILE